MGWFGLSDCGIIKFNKGYFKTASAVFFVSKIGAKEVLVGLAPSQQLFIMQWLTDELKLEIKKAFEPRYKRELGDEEVFDIAENLTGLLQAYYQVGLKGSHE